MPRDQFPQILTPEGKSIVNDESNIGMQLLKKMGWTQNMGLGKDGNGIVEPIRASSNFGRKGFGKGPMQSTVNMVQQAHFDTILQSLNNGPKSDESGENSEQEEKFQLCKPQVRYRKYTRAKDVSIYDQKRLKIILGKAVVESKEPFPSESPILSSSDIEIQTKNVYGVRTYSSSTDLKSYFASKLKEQKFPSPSISSPWKRRCLNDSNYCASEFSKIVDPSDTIPSNEPTSKDSENGLSELPSSKASAVETMDIPASKESPRSSLYWVQKTDISDDLSSSSSTSTETNEDENLSADTLDCFPNSNILSLRGYPYY